MAKINFKEFQIYTGISHRETRTFDVRESLADALYLSGRGIRMHDLALRIFRSDGPVDLDEADERLLQEFAENMSPAFIDSLPLNIQ